MHRATHQNQCFFITGQYSVRTQASVSANQPAAKEDRDKKINGVHIYSLVFVPDTHVLSRAVQLQNGKKKLFSGIHSSKQLYGLSYPLHNLGPTEQ